MASFTLSAFLGVSGFVIRKRKSAGDESVLYRKADQYPDRTTKVFIPNVLTRWPWSRQINPHHAMVCKEADAWITGFQAFSPKVQDVFDCCKISKCFPLHLNQYLFPLTGLLACLTYPNASQGKAIMDTVGQIICLFNHSGHVRTGCDLLLFCFVYDEYVEKSTPSMVRMQKDVSMDAFRNPHKPRPKGEWVGAEIARQ